MYDTIVFHLEQDQFKIGDESYFDGRKTSTVNGRFDVGSSFVNGIREKMKKDKKYYPSVNLADKTIGNSITGKTKVKRLEVQISLPKARYETNKFEIDQNDFDFLYKKTAEYLKMAKVLTDTQSLKGGVLTGVAFSKSTVLPDYFGTAEQVIRRLSPLNYKPRCKFRYRDYNDGWEGVSIKFHNLIRGLGAYCKYSEILNTGFTLAEEEIIKQVLDRTQPKNIYRLELTLQRKQTLEAVLRRFIPTKKKDFTLDDIFTNKDISQKLLLEQFDEVFNPTNVALITLSEMKENKLDSILSGKINAFKDRALMFYLVNMTTKIGLCQTFKRMKQELSSSNFDRLKRELPKIIEELGEMEEPTLNLIEFLRSELVKFEPIKPLVQKTGCQLLLNDLY
ncbi:MAG TPA: hypothetical protein VMV71_04170 [Candidatus Paceibacterota bacterium]|nr:hypothetical protein [Candidatus Paceibacterota bacterium]